MASDKGRIFQRVTTGMSVRNPAPTFTRNGQELLRTSDEETKFRLKDLERLFQALLLHVEKMSGLEATDNGN